MSTYLEIFLEDKIYSQRTPTSKFIEFSLDGTKTNTYEELPEEVKKNANRMIDMETYPEKYFDYEEVEDGIKINVIYENAKTHIKIPEYIEGKPVVELGTLVLSYPLQEETIQIQLPETIKRFNNNCFQGAKMMKYINIPRQITNIPDECFKNCRDLLSIDFSNITKIGNSAFKDCQSLINIDLTSVEEIGEYAFENCDFLKSVLLSDSLKELRDGVFRRCKYIDNVKLPETIKRLGDGVFEDCFYLTTINFPESLTYIDNYCFYRCSHLSNFDAPSNLEYIGENAFGKSGLHKIHLNSKLRKVETCAFSSLGNLEEITLYSPHAYFMRPFDFKDANKIKVISPLGKLLNVKTPERGEER